MSKRQTRYRLRLKVEAIEKARKDMGLTQEEFADQGGFSVGRWRTILRETRKGHFPEIGTGLIAGLLTALNWRLTDAVEQIVD